MNISTDGQDQTDAMQENGNSFVPKDPGKYEPVRTEPLTVTTAGLSSFLQSTPEHKACQKANSERLGDTYCQLLYLQIER